MVTILYQGTLKKGKETEYQQAWHACAKYFVEHCGALDSSLYKTANNEWLAISRWPDQATRDAVWNNPDVPASIQKVIKGLKDCLESYTETSLQLVDQVE